MPSRLGFSRELFEWLRMQGRVGSPSRPKLQARMRRFKERGASQREEISWFRPQKMLDCCLGSSDSKGMSTVMEIEKAIEELPSSELQKLFSWVEEKQAMLDATASVFAIYDEEEGQGLQWHE